VISPQLRDRFHEAKHIEGLPLWTPELQFRLVKDTLPRHCVQIETRRLRREQC